MRNASMVLSDGGSIQEECAYLDKPCLILRRKTERSDGIGKNAVLWGYDNHNLNSFLDMAIRYTPRPAEWPRPSEQIVGYLEKHYC